MTKKRIIFDLLAVCAIFYFPWWVVVPVVFFGAFVFHKYYEVFFFGLLFDILYGASSFSLWGVSGLLAAMLIYITAGYLKKVVR